MAFFQNTKVNLLNMHYAIIAIAHGGAGAFVSAYLLKSGVSLPMVFVALALILLGRFIIRPFVVALAVRIGLRTTVVVGALVTALQFPILAEVDGLGAILVGLCVVSAIGETIYWTSYHAYFAALSDNEHRGQQVGVREAIAGLTGVLSPLLTGLLLVGFGPHAAFGAGAVIMALSIVPLLFAPNIPVARNVKGSFKAALPSIILTISDGWIGASYYFAWQIALFLSLDQSYLAYGGALAIAALVGAIGAMVLGKHIDAGHGKTAVWIACGAVASITVLRAFGVDNAPIAILGNALGALGAFIFVPTVMTVVYTQAKRSPCGLRFNVMMEGGWDIGGASGLLVAALIASLGLPIWVTILTGLFGITTTFLVLPRFYAREITAVRHQEARAADA
jgi:MFS family permease